MHERAFVLVPLLELAPGFQIPGRGPACGYLALLTAEERNSVQPFQPEQRSH
jgi:2-amino-4-hydroxy-6-hydroxymethyldihydropteridine diphosphokinase